MHRIMLISIDFFREALARRWVMIWGMLIGVILLFVALALRLDIVDGALAATRLFGQDMSSAIRPVDMAMRALFKGLSYFIFYSSILIGIVGCAGFGPELLTPGRIEHVLSLPVRRYEIILGLFFGILLLWVCNIVLFSGGFVLILGIKTGFWSVRPLIAGGLAAIAFSAIFAVMLTSAIFDRRTTSVLAMGYVFLLFTSLRSSHKYIIALIEPGIRKTALSAFLYIFPPINDFVQYAAELSGTKGTLDMIHLSRLAAGHIIFATAVLCIGIWKFEREDY